MTRARTQCLSLWVLGMSLAVGGSARQSMAQDTLTALDTLFPSPRWNGVRMYGLGDEGHLDVDPDLIVFNDTIRTATVTVTNPLATYQPLWIAPECGGDGHPQPDEPFAAAWHNQYRCAAPWVSGYPQYVRLVPHERRTFILHLQPYPTLPDGRYIARLMLNGIDHGMGHDETAVEYVKGARSAHLSRTHWAATIPSVSPRTAIQATPAVLVFNQTTRTATIMLTNPAAAATELWLTLDCPWFRVHYETVAGYTHKSQYEYTWHRDVPNIVTWLSGFPQHLVLAPHERRTLTLQLTPFFNGEPYPTGSYYAQLRYVQSPVLQVTADDTVFSTPEGVVNIVVHWGAGSDHLTLMPLQYTRRADGTAIACVTVQQPGLGLVTTLHAALQTTTSVGRKRSVWQSDTTIGVWEIVQWAKKARNSGAPMVPDPVCVPVPHLSSGHYTMVLAVRALGGEAAQVTRPVDMP